jgi:hypothetical protein
MHNEMTTGKTSNRSQLDDDASKSSTGSNLAQMKRPLLIVLWFMTSALVFYSASLFLIGKEEVLKRAAATRPYATIYMPINEEDLAADNMIIFFGDSTLLYGMEAWQLEYENIEGAAEKLELDMASHHAELGEVSVVRWAFPTAAPYHFYCLLFQTEQYSPDLVVIPIRMCYTAFFGRHPKLHQLASMVPISEQFVSDPGNPLKIARIALIDHLLLFLDVRILCAKGAKLWLWERLGLSELSKRRNNMGPQWLGTGAEPAAEDEKFHGLIQFCPDHPALRMYEYIAKTAERRNIKVLFYISPISFERLPGSWEKSEEQFECSVNRLQEVTTTRTTRCVNVVNLLDDDQFMDFAHYNEDGAATLSLALSSEAHKMLMVDLEPE